MTQACSIKPLQNVVSGYSGSEIPSIRYRDLRYARSIALNSADERIYAAGGDGLATFKRADDGTLEHESTFLRREWARSAYLEFDISSVVVSSDDVLFVIGDRSPALAAFNISDQTEGGDPESIGFIDEFYDLSAGLFSSPFYSHVAQPTTQTGCRAVSIYSRDETGPIVDIFCDGQVYSIHWHDEEREFFVADWFQYEQTDRFGNFLSDGLTSLSPKKIVENVHGNRNYVLGGGPTGNLHIFDRATRITENPYTE